MKPNLLQCFFSRQDKRIFVSLVKLLNISLEEHSLFLSHVKSVFFNDNREWTEKTKLVLLPRILIIKLLRVTPNIQLPRLGFKERERLFLYQSQKLFSFIYRKLHEASLWLITLEMPFRAIRVPLENLEWKYFCHPSMVNDI